MTEKNDDLRYWTLPQIRRAEAAGTLTDSQQRQRQQMSERWRGMADEIVVADEDTTHEIVIAARRTIPGFNPLKEGHWHSFRLEFQRQLGLDIADLDEMSEAEALATLRRLQPMSEAGGAVSLSNVTDAPQLVRLDQAAAMVHRGKKVVAKAINADPLAPLPTVEGGGGKPHFYDWSTLRPWLTNKYAINLPERLPS